MYHLLTARNTFT